MGVVRAELQRTNAFRPKPAMLTVRQRRVGNAIQRRPVQQVSRKLGMAGMKKMRGFQ